MEHTYRVYIEKTLQANNCLPCLLLFHLQFPAHVVQSVLHYIHKLFVVDVVVVYHTQVFLAITLALLILHLLKTALKRIRLKF